MKNTVIISGFPGVGKSHFVANSEHLDVLDSDSSKFDKAQFPYNYIDHIESNIGKVDVILVSSHAEVRSALRSAFIKFYTVSPIKKCKEEYLKRYEERGSPQGFIDLIDKNWDQWIEEFNASNQKNAWVLYPGKYLSDVAQDIITEHRMNGVITKDFRTQGKLRFSDYQELLGLEYAIGQGYTKEEKDFDRLAELRSAQ